MGIVLIIGRYDDPHTKSVSSELNEMNYPVKCLDVFNQDIIEVAISSTENQKSFLKFLNSDNDIKAIWFRQKPVVPSPWWGPLQHDAARFAQGEWRTLLQSLEHLLPDVKWINSPKAQQSINHKPKQLELAVSLGFLIPDTLITNSAESVKAFAERHRKIIYKSLSGFVFSDQSGILTTVIDTTKLNSNLESIKKAPGIYQQFIEKKFEARVTVVGNRHFTSFIRTPKEGLGSVDWRHSHFEDIFEEGSLPENIAHCITKFQRAANLHYGAYDFIITPDDNWYFLECNPGGQFLWLENSLGFKISKAIAEDLLNYQKF